VARVVDIFSVSTMLMMASHFCFLWERATLICLLQWSLSSSSWTMKWCYCDVTSASFLLVMCRKTSYIQWYLTWCKHTRTTIFSMCHHSKGKNRRSSLASVRMTYEKVGT
jgi:hypothetical protein